MDAAKETADDALHRAEDLFDDATDKGSELLDQAKDRGEELVKGVTGKAKDLWNKAGEAVDKMDDNPLVQETKSKVEGVGRGVMDAGKSTLDTAAELSEQVGKEVIEKGKIGLEKAADLAENVGEAVTPIIGKMADTFGDAANKAGDRAKSFFDEAQEAAAKAGRDTGDAAESIGDRAKGFFDKAQEAAAKAGRDTGDFVSKTGDSIKDQANRATANADDLFDDLTEKAQNLADDAAAKVTRPAPDVSRSELDDKGDFFTKAARFAEGDYDMDGKMPGDQPVDGKITLIDNTNDHVNRKLPAPDSPPVGGFEDRDGDGNEIIDDAEIVE